MTIPLGQCYSWATMNAREGDTVVHGTVHHPWDGHAYQHAWVERGNRVHDFQTSIGLGPGTKGWDRDAFYAAYKPVSARQYQSHEAKAQLLRHGHHGPWEWVERVLAGERPADVLDEAAGRKAVTHTVPFGDTQLHFTAPSAPSAHHVPVLLDVQKVDRSWQRDRGFHVGPGGSGHAIGDRYHRFGEFLKTGTPIEAPEIGLNLGGQVTFTNGRHRFAYLRDRGLRAMPFWVDRFEAPKIQRHYGVDEVNEAVGLVRRSTQPFLLNDPRNGSDLDTEMYNFGHGRERYQPRHGKVHEFDIVHHEHGRIGTMHVAHTDRTQRTLYVPWIEIEKAHEHAVTPMSLRASLQAHFPRASEVRGWRITGRKPGVRAYTLPPARGNPRQGKLFAEAYEPSKNVDRHG